MLTAETNYDNLTASNFNLLFDEGTVYVACPPSVEAYPVLTPPVIPQKAVDTKPYPNDGTIEADEVLWPGTYWYCEEGCGMFPIVTPAIVP